MKEIYYIEGTKDGVIPILQSKGGINNKGYHGTNPDFYYYIDPVDNIIKISTASGFKHVLDTIGTNLTEKQILNSQLIELCNLITDQRDLYRKLSEYLDKTILKK